MPNEKCFFILLKNKGENNTFCNKIALIANEMKKNTRIF